MRIKNLFLATGLLVSAGALAQSVPTHPNYINYGTDNNQRFTTEFVKMLETWEPGKPYLSPDDPEYSNYTDDNFFISRVRVKDRITNTATQANPNLVPGEEAVNEKKLCWFSPIGEMTKQWSAMSRYTFESDNFSMWQYLDYHGNWSNGWIRVPGVFNDVAHKNGVQTGCLIFFEGSSDPNLPKLTTKENGEFKYARKFVQMLKFYGIDGVGVNPEGGLGSSLASNFQDFFVKCHEIGKELDWPFQVIWYESQSNSGYVSWTDQLNDNNKDWFSKNGKNVTDAFFLNYNWNSTKLKTSQETATSLGRSTYDVYAGMDIECSY